MPRPDYVYVAKDKHVLRSTTVPPRKLEKTDVNCISAERAEEAARRMNQELGLRPADVAMLLGGK